ncbi:hypothetical protein CONCODRAFT_4614 [Conidiobolus coronatus NRRL 28638]|uniref:Uncharacterized protein n=1 Tax=Conidiobolus coronatus (strain ATCC 28846 / CBS 209.66 / NRRL 28638) TaxID=796925 RepID=A0A137PBZ9_CONC2|nr:hypothetical protein CONCODRAFT_4614 [Conidiobolus coronatus NRRL 28638]|eukprot:KXN72516.1 hypothetical protein CONCODRAFT_4614 [Conidiobolus coronatus NRRL 28638]
MTSILLKPSFDSSIMSPPSLYGSSYAINSVNSDIYQPSFNTNITHKDIPVSEFELSKMFGANPLLEKPLYCQIPIPKKRPQLRACPTFSARKSVQPAAISEKPAPRQRTSRWWEPLTSFGWITSLSQQANQICNTSMAYGTTQPSAKSYSANSIKSLKKIKAKYGIVAPMPGKSKDDRYVIDLKNPEDRQLAIEAILYDFKQRNPNFVINDNVDFDDEFIAEFLVEHDIAVV